MRVSNALVRLLKRSWAIAFLVSIVLIGVSYRPALRKVASFLIVEDPLEPASAIVVLGGQVPFRAMEAAQLYQARWAPQIALTRGEGRLREARGALNALGIDAPEEWERSRAVLLRLGVPASAIVVSETPVIGGTLEELETVAKMLHLGATPVILVTSRVHTRRVRLTWRHVTGGKSRPIARIAPRDPFDPNRWWYQRRFIMSVLREYLGLLNYALGFPVAAKEAK